MLDRKAVLYAEGTTIGWGASNDGREGFSFDNPNAVKDDPNVVEDSDANDS